MPAFPFRSGCAPLFRSFMQTAAFRNRAGERFQRKMAGRGFEPQDPARRFGGRPDRTSPDLNPPGPAVCRSVRLAKHQRGAAGQVTADDTAGFQAP